MTTVQMDLPAGISKDDAERVVAMLTEHQGMLTRLSRALAEEDTAVAPAVVSQLARVEDLWRTIEATWGLLSAADVTALTGGNPQKARAHTANLRRRHGVLAVTRRGQSRYPGFQVADDKVRPVWAETFKTLTDAGWTPEEVTLWAVSPTGWLDGRAPVDVADADPEAVSEAVRVVANGTAA
jgi:hypothetical protein